MAAAPSGVPPATTSAAEDTPEAKAARIRSRVLAEMLETEQSYVDSLSVLDIQPIAAAKESILPKKAQDILFSNLSHILNVNQRFVNDLTKSISGAEGSSSVGKLFVQISPFFKMYKDYVRTHDAAVEQLPQLLSKHAKFRDLQSKNTQHPSAKGLSLSAFLIMPIQRIPRYKLLLAELLKHTPSSHSDYELLTEAVKLVNSVAMDVNEAIKEAERRNILVELTNEIETKAPLVAPHRVFYKRGLLTKVCRKEDKVFLFFLFNDLLIYCDRSKVKGKYKIHHELPIDAHFYLESIEEGPPDHAWKVVNPIKSFVCYASSEAEKQEWLSLLRRCVAMVAEGGIAKEGGVVSLKPVWDPDKAAAACPICSKRFTFTFRRHHCRMCGGLCCGDCSKARLVIAADTTSDKKQRVCDVCVRQLGGTAAAVAGSPGSDAGDGRGRSVSATAPWLASSGSQWQRGRANTAAYDPERIKLHQRSEKEDREGPRGASLSPASQAPSPDPDSPPSPPGPGAHPRPPPTSSMPLLVNSGSSNASSSGGSSVHPLTRAGSTLMDFVPLEGGGMRGTEQSTGAG